MNEKKIQTIALEEIWKQNSDGYLPVLVEIYNPDIVWDDNSLEQENMYLRVVNDTNNIVYKGKKYLAASFTYKPPEEDGKKISDASITISTIDTRVIQFIRSIELPSEVTIIAAFAKNDTTYMFYPLDKLKATLPSATYNQTTASFNLVFKNAMTLNVPRDVATKNQLPSVNEND